MSAKIQLTEAMLMVAWQMSQSPDRELAREASEEHSRLSAKRVKLLRDEPAQSRTPQPQEVTV